MAFFLSLPPHLHAFISACRFHLNSQLQRISRKPLRSPNPTKTRSFKTMTTYSFESMKMEKIRAPYGSWKPPITAELSPAPPSYSMALPLIPSATSSGSSHAPMLGGLGEGRRRTAMHYWTLQAVIQPLLLLLLETPYMHELRCMAAETHKFESHYIDNLVGNERDYFDRSPINFVDKFFCPIILFQGLEDKSLPPAQARNIYHALKEKGLPVALVEYEGEQHGFRKVEAESIKFTLEQQMVVFARLVGRLKVADEITPIRIDNFDIPFIKRGAYAPFCNMYEGLGIIAGSQSSVHNKDVSSSVKWNCKFSHCSQVQPAYELLACCFP